MKILKYFYSLSARQKYEEKILRNFHQNRLTEVPEDEVGLFLFRQIYRLQAHLFRLFQHIFKGGIVLVWNGTIQNGILDRAF